MIEAVVMESYANSICLFGAARLAKLITRAYANGGHEWNQFKGVKHGND